MDDEVDRGKALNEFAMLVKTAGLDLDAVIARAATNQLNDRILNDPKGVSDMVLDLAPKTKNAPLDIPYSLTAADATRLQAEYASENPRLVGKIVHPHAMAAAERLCAESYALSLLRYSKDWEVRESCDVPIVDVGGNYARHAKLCRFNVHSCSPILDARDSARETERAGILND